MQGVPFSSLRDFPKIFLDFIEDRPFIKERFPLNSKLYESEEEFFDRAVAFKTRKEIAALIKRTMSSVQLSEQHKTNISMLENHSALVVTAKCRPSFLGGPISNLITAFSTLALADKLNKSYEYISFIPLLFIDDDRQDNLEVTRAEIFDDKYKVKTISSRPFAGKTDRTVVSELFFDKSIVNIIEQLHEYLPDSEHKQQLIDELSKIYTTGNSYPDSFVSLIDRFTNEYGLLFISNSSIRKLGMYDELAMKELHEPGNSFDIIRNSENILKEKNYQIKAKVNDINLLFHDTEGCEKISKFGTEKYKIKDRVYNLDSLIRLAEKEKGQFSPYVMLDYVFRHSIMPTAAEITNPSGIGHASMLKELYSYFKTPMPAFFPRHSATLNDNAAFFRLRMKHLDNLVFNFVFPRGNLHERIISQVYFTDICGKDKLQFLLSDLVENPPEQHYSVTIS